MKLMKEMISFLFRIIIGGIFTVSGLSKIADPISFYSTLMGFRILPDSLLSFMAVSMPWLELLLGLAVLLGILYTTGALMLAAINTVFALAIVSVIARRIDIDCGCFGLLADILHIPDKADWTAVVRDMIFTAMSYYIFHVKTTVFSLENYLRKRGGN
jgi:putative oxidoreductase